MSCLRPIRNGVTGGAGRRRAALAALAAAVLGGVAAVPDGEVPPFRLAITAPRPLFLLGRCEVEAGAIGPDGAPYASIAYMTLSLDGLDLGADAEPPFRWQVDAGETPRQHRLVVAAVSRAGGRVELAARSSASTFVEAVSVDLVLVPVVVRDAAGRAVTDLGVADFTILEDGAVRPVATFSSEPAPASVVIALDNSRSMEGHLWSAQRAALEFLEAQPGSAEVSLLTFNDQVFLDHEFTSSRSDLARAVAAVRASGTRTALYDALKVGSSHLARRPGARVLVLFTDGEETLYEGEEGRLQTSLEAAQAADVVVYALAYGPAAGRTAALSRVARETGGEMVIARSSADLRGAFRHVTEAIGARYLLGYEPPESQRRGYRRIDVRVSRPEVTVLARRGYWRRRD